MRYVESTRPGSYFSTCCQAPHHEFPWRRFRKPLPCSSLLSHAWHRIRKISGPPIREGLGVMIAQPAASKENNVGRFHIEFELANYEDVVQARMGHLPPERVRRRRVSGVVDTGRARLVLPQTLAEELGLRNTGPIAVRYADGRREHRPLVVDAQVEIQGRSGVFSAVLEPGRSDALIGAIVLEELDLLVDCTGQKLVARDPEGPLAEIE